MTYQWQTWLADEFRAAGLTVHEVTGWRTRGRPASTGAFAPEAQTVHHTGTHTSPTNPHPTLATLIQGRSDLPGPLAQFSVDHNGDVWVIAAGRCNHAGRVDHGMPGMPTGSDGNAHAFGDEVDTDGRQTLPPAQIRGMAITHRVILKHTGHGSTYLHRHADIAPNRKWDIGSRSTPQLRRDVDGATPPPPEDDMDTQELLAALQSDAGRAALSDAVLATKITRTGRDGEPPSEITVERALEDADTRTRRIEAKLDKALGLLGEPK